MYQRSLSAVLLVSLLHTVANASGGPAIPFVDGLWSGGTETGANSSGFVECWARTTTHDGTTFTLANRDDGSWHLLMSNPDWLLPPSQQFDISALVDFYPQQVSTVAETTSRTGMKIADLKEITLLALIENGHTIDFKSTILNAKYDLEGSAKAIQRIRTCFTNRN